MIITVFGATGATGQEVVKQALQKGYDVQALVRNPHKLAISDKNLTVIAGDALQKEDVIKAIAGADAVICVLGAPPHTKTLLLRDATNNIIDAMKEKKVTRLLVQTSNPLVGDTSHMELFSQIMLGIVRKFSGIMVTDKKEQEAIIQQSGLIYTIIRPVVLTNEMTLGKYRTGETLTTSITNKISRADVAAYILASVADKQTFKKIEVISN